MMKYTVLLLTLLCSTLSVSALTVDMYLANDSATGQGKKIGQVLLETSAFGGVLLTPQLTDLPPGVHGFHVHVMPSCAPSFHEGHASLAGQAGGHLDPAQTNRHKGPYGKGHLGDLPVLVVTADGSATLPVLAPRLTLEDFNHHTLMIHAGGDNYSDTPEPLGGGAIRLACGVISR